MAATSSSADLICSVENGRGVIDGADVADIRVACECTTAICQGPSDEGPEEPTRISRYDICFDFPALCSVTGLDPWWHNGPGPGTGGSPCQRQTTCTDLGVDCSEEADDGTPICANRLDCHDVCTPSATLALTGPSVLLDNFEPQTVSGRLLLTGFARDVDGLRDLRLYLDGELLAPAVLEMGQFRGDSCDGVAGDCDPFSGFTAELDSLDWADGVHRLEIIAIDGELEHPMATVVEREIVVDNSCTVTGSPTVTMTAPAAGDFVAGQVSVTATAQAEAGVEKVQFFIDDVRLGTDWAAPFQWPWDSTTAEDGFHEIRARVVDECGGIGHSEPVIVETTNNNAPPMVELELPLPGATISGSTVGVSGWALDEDGIDSIALRLNGQVVTLAGPLEVRTRSEICSSLAIADPRCPDVGWALEVNTEAYPDGPYQLEVIAHDGRGGVRTIARQIDIDNNPPQPPGVGSPGSINGVLGDTVTFQVHTWGEGPHAFQWQERREGRWLNLWDGAREDRVSGVTTDSLSVQNLQFSDAGGYRCLVSNAGGATASPSASLTVAEGIDAPTVVAGIDQTAVEGTDVNLTVSAEGAGTLTYQWQKWAGSYYADVGNGGGVSGARSPALSFTAVEWGAEGRYRCQVENAGGTTPSSGIELTVAPDLSGSCNSTPTALCLQQSRFQVETLINGATGLAKPYSDLGGFFTRNNPENIEVGVKVLDGIYINGRYWVFHGSMTSLPYTVTVTDTVTGAAKSYHKESDSFCGEADTQAFANPSGGSAALVAGSFIRLRAVGESTSGSCESSATAQCLLSDRFRVQVFRNGSAQRAVPVTGLSAAFTFGSTANPEVMVKVLDGTSVNDWYWVFFGSLTGQEYEVRVTDTTDGTVNTYPSPAPTCGQADTTAF